MKTWILIWLILALCACAGCKPTPPDSAAIPPSTTTTLPPSPTATSPAQATATPPPPTVTPTASATPTLIPTPTSAAPESYDLSMYEDVTTWETYALQHTKGTLLAPPGWVVRESEGRGDLLYSISFRPPLWDSPQACGYQCPEIGMAVFQADANNAPPGELLRDWLARRATSEPFGSEAHSDVIYFGVTDTRETTLGALPALGFYHEAMGIPIYTVLATMDDVIVELTKTHIGQFEFEPIYDLMRSHAKF